MEGLVVSFLYPSTHFPITCGYTNNRGTVSVEGIPFIDSSDEETDLKEAIEEIEDPQRTITGPPGIKK